MKKILHLSLFVLSLTILLTSCSESTTDKQDSKKTTVFQKNKTTLQWTAYKTTDKIGVKGTFNQIEVNNSSQANSVEEIINSTSFKIPTSSVFTGNAPRDLLIKDYFFGAMLHTDTIYGSFVSAKDGKGLVMIKMNDVEYKNNFTYSFENDSLKINATMELDNWNGYKALASLHEQCYDKHTGPDGVSKTWSDVDLKIISIFK